MEPTLRGIVTIRPASELPCVRFKRGNESVIALVHVTQLEKAKALVGKEVGFILLDRPYGPHITSDVGFAKIIGI